MPELPEVETIVRGIKAELIGKAILSADLFWRAHLQLHLRKIQRTGAGTKIKDVTAAQSTLICVIGFHLLIHLRMSGDIMIRQSKPSGKT